MTPYWFTKQLPASRHTIENAVRLAFWARGFGDTFFSCVNPEPPIKCTGLWKSTIPLEIEWVPLDYFKLQMPEPNKEVLEAFERVLGHRASAAYRAPNGQITVEWWAKNPEGRWAELEKSQVPDLERLS